MVSTTEDIFLSGDDRTPEELGPCELAEDAWFPSLYDCLHDIAEQLFRHEAPGHTLQPTAIVHEAYMRLACGELDRWRDRTHFLAVASRTLRDVLVDHARRRGALKRGGDRRRVDLYDSDACSDIKSLDLLAFDEALTRLSKNHDRAGRVVELRYFSGLSIEEAAGILEVSPRTVKSDWRFARAWLNHALMVDT